jgi:hypothetical protein
MSVSGPVSKMSGAHPPEEEKDCALKLAARSLKRQRPA